MTMFIYFFCLCPLSLTVKLNFKISKVAYWLIRFFPFFAILSENEELKEQLAQLAETKV